MDARAALWRLARNHQRYQTADTVAARPISAPGFYPDINAETYFSDPIIRPSLTQSLCKILLERSPLHAWYAHPRLNPDYAPDDDTKFDIGNLAHTLLLGKG